MTYQQTKNAIWQKICIHWALFLFAFTLLLMASLKYVALVVSLDTGSLLSQLSRGILSLISTIYQNTQFLGWFWKVSPTLTFPTNEIPIWQLTTGNMWAIALLCILLLSFYFQQQVRNLKKILHEVEYEGKKAKLRATMGE
jgi:hypothetical protein